MNAFGFYTAEIDAPVKSIPYLSIFMNVLPNICQLLGTITLMMIDSTPKLQTIFFKSRRSSYIKLGAYSSCVIMGTVMFL